MLLRFRLTSGENKIHDATDKNNGFLEGIEIFLLED